MFLALLHWCTSAFALLVTAYLVPGFKVRSFGSALIAAFVIGVAAVVLWPLLIFLTLPLNILTLGLFTFVVNGALLKICSGLVPGFRIEGWGAAILGAFILAIVATVLHYLLV